VGQGHSLQRLLTHSHSGKALAVRRVTENQGKNTPGVDRVRWNTPEKKATAVHALRRRGYRPPAAPRLRAQEHGHHDASAGYPCHDGSGDAEFVPAGLDPVAEVLADPNSYGFRVARAPPTPLRNASRC
jgi:RNA-directed DNA polymerase